MSSRKTGAFLKKKVSVDQLQRYLACGVKLHPHMYTFFISSLSTLESKGKICLVPGTIFQIYHLRFKKVINF